MRRNVTALIPTAVAALVVAWVLATNNWSIWGVDAMALKTPAPTSFADLANITATADCLTAGTDISVCDPYGRPFQPYVVLPARALALVGLGTADTGPIGYGLAFVYVVTVAGLALVLARGWRGGARSLVGAQAILAVAAITAPAVLAIERGQIELLALALTVLALALLAGQHRLHQWMGTISGFLATITKFFAIGLFLPSLRRRPQWVGVIGLAVGVGYLLLNLDDVSQASAAARTDLPATSKSQFGAATLVATILSTDPLGYTPSEAVAATWPTVRIVGIAIFIVCALMAAVLIPSRFTVTLTQSSIAWWLVIGSTGVLVPPYLLGASHDYRLVFALPLLVGALVWASAGRSRGFALTMAALVGVALITSAAMVPTPQGWIWGKWWITLGDVALLIVLASGIGIWLRDLLTPPDTCAGP